MAIFSPNTVDFTKVEIDSISEAIYERTFSNPMLTDYFIMNNGVKKDQQIAILGRMQTKLGKGSGGCEPTATTNAIPMSQKVWSTSTISDRLGFCWTTDVKGTFFQWATKNGVAKEDLTATTFAAFIVERMEDAMNEMHHRLFWFNDKAAALVPTGVITATEDIDFYNKVNGAWKQFFAIGSADPDRISTGLSAKNGQATYALQKFDVTDRTNLVVSNTLDEIVKDADERLVDGGSLKLVCTKSVWDQYRSELKFANVSFTTERLESGIEVLYADGLELHKYSIWDRIIKESFDDGAAYFLPHRILMYDANTLQAATEEESTLSEVDIFYDKTLKKTFFDFQFDLDIKVIEEYLVQMAY